MLDIAVANPTAISRATVQQRLRSLVRKVGDDIRRVRIDTSASQAAVAREAGIDRSHVTRIEAGTTQASLETLVAIATALGADVSVRLYPGRGLGITDRHQAPMIECLLGQLGSVWRPHLEVGDVPASRGGSSTTVLERRDHPLLVIG